MGDARADLRTPGERLQWYRENYARASARSYAKALTSLGYPITHTTLRRYEKRSPLPPEFLSTLAKLGMNLHWLVTGVGTHYTPDRHQSLATGVAASAYWLREISEMLSKVVEWETREEPEDQELTFESPKLTLTVRWKSGWKDTT